MEANHLNDLQPLRRGQLPVASARAGVEFSPRCAGIEKYSAIGDKSRDWRRKRAAILRAGARAGASCGRGGSWSRVQHRGFPPNTRPGESVTIAQGNAWICPPCGQRLRCHGAAAASLGPLYHLYTQDDKRRALREAIRHSRAVVFAAYVISDGRLLDEGSRRGNISVAEYVRDGCWMPDVWSLGPSQRICLDAGAQRGC